MQQKITVVNVAEALRLPALAAGQPRVIAGESRLDGVVRWVHVTEQTDPASILEGGELVLTTGLSLPADPVRLRDYVDQLADIGAACLVIELGRRYQRLPGELVAACRSRELPLVSLARGVKFIKVTQELHTLILDRQGEALRRSHRVHDAFNALTLRGAAADELVRSAAEMTGRPVVLENLVHQAVVCEPAGRPIEQVLYFWERRSRAAATPVGAGPVGPEGWLVVPVEYRGRVWGRLIMLPDADSPPPAPEQVTVLERASAALTLARLTQDARGTDWEGREHRRILLDMIDRRYRSLAEIRARATALGLRTTGHRFTGLLIGRQPRFAAAGSGGDAAVERIGRELRHSGIRALVGEFGPTRIGVLLALPQDRPREPVARRLGRWVREEFGAGTVVGLGPEVADLAEVARSFREAEQVLEAVRPGSSDEPFLEPSDIGLPELLYALRDDTRVQRFAERRLGRLLEHDAGHGGDLLPVLRAYLASAGNKSTAARACGLSRQAFYHRLHTIERLLGGLEEAGRRTQLDVALTILDALDSDTPSPHQGAA